MFEDDYILVRPLLNKEQEQLMIEVAAKKDIVITEIQGDVSVIDALGASIPSGFQKKQFGEGVIIPNGMQDEIDFMNKFQFRWACNTSLKAGNATEIVIPSNSPVIESGVLTLAYKFSKLFGLVKKESAIYVHLKS